MIKATKSKMKTMTSEVIMSVMPFAVWEENVPRLVANFIPYAVAWTSAATWAKISLFPMVCHRKIPEGQRGLSIEGDQNGKPARQMLDIVAGPLEPW